ncbi:class I SAM-dependent methyltransferase [Actinoplanes sp. NPDC023714]|uniref:class I SAM-dependent methyltransferase n=1 Tax=Actinoplanes sp. NPDC023714 TaxID=3154322 RepID=UPI0033CBD11F
MTTVKHPVRGPVNAAIFRTLDGYAHRLWGERKRRLFADLPGTVVEIGAGTGANMRYYRPGTKVIAVEPSPYMHKALLAEARRRNVAVEIRAEGAERMSLPDGFADAVVCTLVLCTVPDPAAAIREVGRILRPGGRLVFIEHVQDQEHAGYVVTQRIAARPWRWLFEGCDVRRDTEAALRAGGFTEVGVERYRLRSVFLPINTQIAGVATK